LTQKSKQKKEKVKNNVSMRDKVVTKIIKK